MEVYRSRKQMRDHLQPTFVIELELIMLTDPSATYRPAAEYLEPLLSEAFIDKCCAVGCDINHEHRLPVSSHPADTHKWTVQDNSQIQPVRGELKWLPAEPQVKWRAVTLRSPVFDYHLGKEFKVARHTWPGRMPGHSLVVTPEWAIRHALRILNSVNKDPGHFGVLGIYTNTNTNLRIHVGNGTPSRGFRLDTVKNVLTFMIFFDRLFDSVRCVARPGRAFPIEMSLADAVGAQERLWQAQGFPELFIAWSGFRARGLLPDISSLYIEGEDGCLTFRDHLATLNVDELMATVNTDVGIVRFVESAGPVTLARLLSRWQDLDVTLPQLLRRIAVNSATVRYYDYVLDAARQQILGTYALERYHEELAEVDNRPIAKFIGHDPAQKLLRAAVVERFTDRSPAFMNAAIRWKLRSGRYGWVPPSGLEIPDAIKTTVMVDSPVPNAPRTTTESDAASGSELAAKGKFAPRPAPSQLAVPEKGRRVERGEDDTASLPSPTPAGGIFKLTKTPTM